MKEIMESIVFDVFPAEDCECVSHAFVYGLQGSIRGAKFPMAVDTNAVNDDLTDGIKTLAMTNPGEGHDQWLTGVVVQLDLTLSVKAWTEAERYGHLDFISSQSTMHRITRFDVNKAYNKYVDPRIVEIMSKKVDSFNDDFPNMNIPDGRVEEFRDRYLEILYSNPAGFRLTARMTTNYRQLKIIYRQRRSHRLPEWRQFCKWIESLPYSYLITGKEQEK